MNMLGYTYISDEYMRYKASYKMNAGKLNAKTF
jgi:hypothetical protein